MDANAYASQIIREIRNSHVEGDDIMEIASNYRQMCQYEQMLQFHNDRILWVMEQMRIFPVDSKVYNDFGQDYLTELRIICQLEQKLATMYTVPFFAS